MRGISRFLIVLLMLVALPLRGYAAVAAELCEAHHGGAPAAHALDHDHASGHEHGAHEGDRHSLAFVCSTCSTCAAGASLAPDSIRPIELVFAVADRIPFFGRQASGHVPDRLDRPPLAL